MAHAHLCVLALIDSCLFNTSLSVSGLTADSRLVTIRLAQTLLYEWTRGTSTKIAALQKKKKPSTLFTSVSDTRGLIQMKRRAEMMLCEWLLTLFEKVIDLKGHSTTRVYDNEMLLVILPFTPPFRSMWVFTYFILTLPLKSTYSHYFQLSLCTRGLWQSSFLWVTVWINSLFCTGAYFKVTFGHTL